ncbi:GlxA family transcriptional regulator [Methylobacterium planeticum]|uniref:GlxA family transcriptional regulator n=1 Tax=Methylobacterium planeticum TaxID=2615211 RepID=A0A6N6MP88_9HYPH|nr:GlxA family transcriptional regulator [Methylobacterium planeticum]KAB1073165.1 GlxA family transcriptional regulator [Methylobacterium planeticum]
MPATPRFLPNAPRRIEILIFPGVQLLDVTGPLQVFATANDLSGLAEPMRPYAPQVVASGGGSITASAGLGLVAAPLPPAEAPLDTLLVPGGSGVSAACGEASLCGWVRGRAGAARRVVSVCTGAFLLAEAGLLDGRRAVTHWTRCAALAERYPAVRVEPDPIFLRDGPIWTSAGVTAGIDLALALVEADLGRPAALAVARHLVVFLKRPGGQAQFSAALALQGLEHRAEDRFGRLHAWIAEHLTEDLSVPALAREAGMSLRSFARHYRMATGLTPGEAVERLRLEAARRILCETGLPVKRVAIRCGLGSEETLRRTFLRHLGVNPQDYRNRFSAGAEDA